VFVLAPGTSDQTRREVDALLNRKHLGAVVHPYATDDLVRGIVHQRGFLRAAAWQQMKIASDHNVSSWRRSFRQYPLFTSIPRPAPLLGLKQANIESEHKVISTRPIAKSYGVTTDDRGQQNRTTENGVDAEGGASVLSFALNMSGDTETGDSPAVSLPKNCSDGSRAKAQMEN